MVWKTSVPEGSHSWTLGPWLVCCLERFGTCRRKRKVEEALRVYHFAPLPVHSFCFVCVVEVATLLLPVPAACCHASPASEDSLSRTLSQNKLFCKSLFIMATKITSTTNKEKKKRCRNNCKSVLWVLEWKQGPWKCTSWLCVWQVVGGGGFTHVLPRSWWVIRSCPGRHQHLGKEQCDQKWRDMRAWQCPVVLYGQL